MADLVYLFVFIKSRSVYFSLSCWSIVCPITLQCLWGTIDKFATCSFYVFLFFVGNHFSVFVRIHFDTVSLFSDMVIMMSIAFTLKPLRRLRIQ